MAVIKGKNFTVFLLFIIVVCCVTNCSLPVKDDYLVLFTDTISGDRGYRNQKNEIVIPAGKYAMCFTDTFSTYAIVLDHTAGIIAIDRSETILYKVFEYDNGPDMPYDGAFRIIKESKIGYADSKTGKVLIEPKFACAEPFLGGKAKVSYDCTTQSDGEHQSWYSTRWFYINRSGETLAN